jgi:hypothetical protein
MRRSPEQRYREKTRADAIYQLNNAQERIAELEAALRPFATSYRELQNSGLGSMKKEYLVSWCTGARHTVQDFARAAELLEK